MPYLNDIQSSTKVAEDVPILLPDRSQTKKSKTRWAQRENPNNFLLIIWEEESERRLLGQDNGEPTSEEASHKGVSEETSEEM